MFHMPGALFPSVTLVCLYKEIQPQKPRRPYTTDPKPHQLATWTPKTQCNTQNREPQAPKHDE